eukprot:c15989_g1_i1.p1 GENE.c15989_g1_i1~~c15989_g1_i1.p1  ORF type:complete len:248 (+),score=89.75 c15989_g1_i1:35-745(+)
MADNWDDDDATPALPVVKPVKSSWNDDDDDSGLKDAWDQEEEKPAVKAPAPTTTAPAPKPKDKKKIAAEKALQEKKDIEAAQNLTPEQKAEQKAREERLVRESDEETMRKAFGVAEASASSAAADVSLPTTEVEANIYAATMAKKFLEIDNTDYAHLLLVVLKEFLTEVTNPLTPDEVKELSSKLSVIHSEKLKATKDKKKGKKKTGPSATMGKKNLFDDIGGGGGDYDDPADDFM